MWSTNYFFNIKEEDVASEMRSAFYRKLTKLVNSKSFNSILFSKAKYSELIKHVKEAKTRIKKEPCDYRRLKRYDIINTDGIDRLITPLNNNKTNVQYFVHTDELFDILHETHITVEHGGREKMERELHLRYKNVTRETVMLYVNLCKYCQEKRLYNKLINKNI